DAALDRALDRRRTRPHALIEEDEIGIGQGRVVARGTEDELRGRVAEPRDALSEPLPRQGVADRDPRAVRGEEARDASGSPALPEADDRHAPVAEVVRPNVGIEDQAHAPDVRAVAGRPMMP